MKLLDLLLPSLRWSIRRVVLRLQSRAFYAGVISGDPRWRNLLLGIWAWRVVSKVVGKRPESVSVERLRVGETVVVRAFGRNER